MGGKPTEIEGFYPAWELDSNTIKCLSVTDTPPPSYMVNDPTFWLIMTLKLAVLVDMPGQKTPALMQVVRPRGVVHLYHHLQHV